MLWYVNVAEGWTPKLLRAYDAVPTLRWSGLPLCAHRRGRVPTDVIPVTHQEIVAYQQGEADLLRRLFPVPPELP